MPAGRTETARLQLLGRFSLTAPDGLDATPRSAKARAVLAYVVLSGGIAERSRLATLLWSEGADAMASLRQCLRDVRRALDIAGLSLRDDDERVVALDLGGLFVDALEVARIAGQGESRLQEMATLWHGDLLDGLDLSEPGFDDWLVIERGRLHERAVVALEHALRRHLGLGDSAEASRLAHVLLRVEPAHEAAHRAIMIDQARRGDAAALRRQYELCRAALAHHLDSRPAPETVALLERARQPTPPAIPATPPASLRRTEPARTKIAIEELCLTSGTDADRSVSSAVVAMVRQSVARKRWLLIVESPRHAGRLISPQSVPMMPDYVVGISVFRMQQRLRVAAELRRASEGRVLWADHYERTVADDMLEVVDDLSGRLARWLDGEVEQAEIDRAALGEGSAQSGYDLALRAIPMVFRVTPDSFATADRLLRAAIEAEPNDSHIYAWRAFWAFLNIGQGWAADRHGAKAEVGFIVRRALELDPRNSLALAMAAHTSAFVEHDYERALTLFDKSLKADPHSTYAWDLSALTLCYTGQAERAIERLNSARELWERHPNQYFFRTTACIALLLAGQYERTVELCKRTIAENPNFHAPYRPLLAALGHLGRVEEARRYLAALLLHQPDFSIDWFRRSYPPLHGDYEERYLSGLRKAGVPEA